MLARKRSLVSWSVACAGSRMFSFQRLARIEATAGLQISQPWPVAVRGDQGVERLDPLDLGDLEELLAAVREVLAKVVVDRLADRLELGLEQVGHLRQAAAAAGAGLGARLDLGDRGEPLGADCVADLALADVVARADLGVGAHARRGARRWFPAQAGEQLAGATGRGFPLLKRPTSVPYSEASPTRMPPIKRVPSALNTSFL